MLKRAFTLIELLVVIAIIAILAAILFPVFAQAKAAAKKAVSISNSKEIGLSEIMYGDDSNDVVVPDTSWNTGNDPLSFGTGAAFSTWAWLTSPYIKNADILGDPQVGGITPINFGAADNAALTNTTWPDYGYNYFWLSPWNGTVQSPVSDTAINRPAETVMFAAQGAGSELKNPPPTIWGFQFSGQNDPPLISETVEAPGCTAAQFPQFCGGGWSANGFNKNATTNAAGLLTGGVSVRAGNQAVVQWLDGHTTAISPGALAVGTNWTPQSTTDALPLTNWSAVNLWGGN